jgi:hypothetical protein
VDGQALASTLYVDVYSFTKDTNPGTIHKNYQFVFVFLARHPKKNWF